MKKILCFLFAITVISAACMAQDYLREIKSGKSEKINGKDYYLHTVLKGQTLYMIGKAYGTDVDLIIRENPEIKEGLKAGQILRIPFPGNSEPLKKSSKAATEEKKPIAAGVPDENTPCGDKSVLKKSYTVALMIPLYLTEVSGIETSPENGAPPLDYRSLQFVPFYEGFRMAMDSLEKSGISVKVNVYSAEKDSANTAKILRDPELKNADLIIGLMYHHNFQMVADFAEKNRIPLVNPLSERDQIIDKHKHVFKVRPSQKTQVYELVKYLRANYADSNIIVSSDSQRPNKTLAINIMGVLEDNKADCHLAEGQGEVLSLLSASKGNLIVMISDDKSYVLDALTKLNERRTEFRMTLLGLPRWDRFDDIEADYLVNLKTIVMAPYFVDYDDPSVKKFVSDYQRQYETDPDILAFQGFDITWYFISALWKYGSTMERCITGLEMKSLQSDFRFIPLKDNGFENQNWEMYQYDNYHLRRIPVNP